MDRWKMINPVMHVWVMNSRLPITTNFLTLITIMGFFEKDTSLKEGFTTLISDTHITTFDDSSEMKKDIQAQLDQKLAQLRQTRDTDVPRPIHRIGMEEMPPISTSSKNQYESAFSNMTGGGSGSSSSSSSSSRSTQPPAPRYDPNPFAGPTLPAGITPPVSPYLTMGRGIGAQPTYPSIGRGTGPQLPFMMAYPNGISTGPSLPFPMVGQGQGQGRGQRVTYS